MATTLTVTLWIISVTLIVAGLVGTVLPALPGVAFIFGGILLGAWIDDFTVVSTGTVIACGVIAALAWAVEYVAGVLGAKKVGASRQAIIGSLIGTVVGIFTGLWGLLFMPLVGAAIGQYIVDRDLMRARHVGVATWLGMVIGMLAKIALSFLMIGIFVVALLTP